VRTFPFSAVVGSHDMALALILTTVSPEVGGVLVRGEKGTAKTTMVRALADVMPSISVVEGCRFSCDPLDPDPTCPAGPHDHPAAHTRPARLVELPVGATEDRVIGSLDLRQALGSGEVSYEPGLLAAAHRGILYVDEVNLLHDHLVDLLLDAAAMGRSTVEREGVSVAHAARLILIGTMNPEEGELRPQLLDRFGLTVEIAAPRDPEQRAEVIRRRMAFDRDPASFVANYAAQEEGLRVKIATARSLLPSVQLGDRELATIARVCGAFEVDGMRADIVTARAAAAHAAWQGRREITKSDIGAAAIRSMRLAWMKISLINFWTRSRTQILQPRHRTTRLAGVHQSRGTKTSSPATGTRTCQPILSKGRSAALRQAQGTCRQAQGTCRRDRMTTTGSFRPGIPIALSCLPHLALGWERPAAAAAR
jgi:magnesium chelatase subunit D